MNTHRLSALVRSLWRTLAGLFTDQYTVVWEPLPRVPAPATTAAPPTGGRYEAADLVITLRPGTTDGDARRVAEAYRELGLGESRLVRTARGHELLVTRTRGRWHERDSVL